MAVISNILRVWLFNSNRVEDSSIKQWSESVKSGAFHGGSRYPISHGIDRRNATIKFLDDQPICITITIISLNSNIVQY